MYGVIEQGQSPQPAGGPIRFALWGHDVRAEWWQVRPDAPSLGPPGWLTWEFELALSRRQTLGARYWAGGVSVRAGFAAQIAWLAEARRTRPAPACHEQAETNYET
jgi:hypothetical protein